MDTRRPPNPHDPLNFLSLGGEMGRLVRDHPWPAHPLGPVERWPVTLVSTLGITLSSRFPMAIYWADEGFLLYNDAWRPILGDKHPWALGRPAIEVWPEIWDVIAPLFRSVRVTGEGTWRGNELLLMKRFGFTEECYFDYTFNPIRGHLGGVEGILNVVQETTTRVIGERRLETLRKLGGRTLVEAKTAATASEAAAAVLAENPNDIPFAAIYLLHEEGATATLCRQVGLGSGTNLTPAEIRLHGREDLWSFGEALRSNKTVVFADIQERLGEFAGAAPGDEFMREAAVVPLAKPGTQEIPAGFLVTGISPRLAFNNEYRAFVELIGGHIATAIANARAYEETQKRAEALAEIDRAKTAFFSNVSHEFRTPLTLLLGPAEEALADPETVAANRERIRVIHRNALRLQKLVNTLLDFSRIEAGRMKASYSETDLAGLTNDLASVFRSTMEKAGLRFTVDCPPLAKTVFVDRDMWEKIVFNLLSNAFKFTLEGEIKVELRDGSDGAILNVRDSGIGIPKEELPNVFKRFHRVEGRRGRTHEGTGIGLALVQELVHLHGGDIRVESQPGRGTLFQVRLPFGKAHLPPERVSAASAVTSIAPDSDAFLEEAFTALPNEIRSEAREVPASSALTSSGRERVLLAEDNADMRLYVQRLLETCYTVETAPNGAAALNAARKTAPDLILSDVMMPEMNGFQLVQSLRADEKLRTIPIILLSARAGEEARAEGMSQLADDYLTKPFSARELLARVATHLKLSQARREAADAVQRTNAELVARIAELRESNAELDASRRAALRVMEEARAARQEAERAAEAWRESEERFRAFVTTSSDVVYRMSPDWSEMRSLAGKDFIPDSADPNRGWLEKYIPPEDHPRVMAAIHQAIRAKSPFELEHRVIRVDGTLGWTFSRAIPLLDRNGEIVEWFGAATDVTERRRAEEALRRSEEQLRFVTDHAPVLIVHCDAEERFKFVNAPYAARFGLAAEAAVGKSIREIVGETAYQGFRKYVEKALTGERVEFDERIHYETLGPRWMHCVYVPQIESGGKVSGFVAVIQDVTWRKEAEEALRENEAVLRSVTSEARVGLVMVNEARRYLFANQTYAEILGLADANIVGLRVAEVLPTLYEEQIKPRLDRAMAGERVSYELRFPNRGSTREEHFYEVTYEPRNDHRGRYVVVVLVDITERKKAQEILERTVAERTEKLRETIGELESYSYSIVHDMRAPLRSMQGFSNLLRSEFGGKLGQDGAMYLQRISNSAERMDRLIQDVLSFSRVARSELKLEPVNLDPLVRDIVETYPNLRSEKDHIQITGTLPVVLGNEAGLTQCLSNLLGNAVKFVAPGTRPVIRVWAEQSNGRARIFVQDRGIGVPEPSHARIFEMFQRATAAYEGTGIGLPIVKKTIERMGGSVGLRSQLGKGSTFWLELKVAS